MEKAILQQLHPVLQVRDVRRAVDFYVECLGFEVSFFMGSIEPVPCAAVSRDGIELYLELIPLELVDDDAAVVTPTRLRFLVHDPDALHRELSKQGKLDPLPPVGYGPWDTRDLSLEDPDGNKLIFYRMLVDDELK
jgi:catechol 2,3-dioxygenase-like lactoylglutathione lyase family enzyme